MAHFYEAAEAAAVSGDGEMAFFYAAAAAAKVRRRLATTA